MSGDICGYVVRGETPIADTAITVVEGPGGHVDIAPLTDLDGWFCLDDLASGLWLLRAHSPDGASGEASVYVWDNSLSEVTITLGEVKPHTDNWPEAGGADPVIQSYSRAESGSDNDRPFGAKQSRISRSKGRARDSHDLGSGSVMGRVTDAITGRPVPNAVVVITDGPGPLPDLALLTDAEGVFAIPAMQPGNWALRIDANDGGQAELVVAVLNDYCANIVISLTQ